MKNLITLICLLFAFSLYSQVGIGTTEPQGALDVNNERQGFVPPRVQLFSRTMQAPIVNPKEGETVIPNGTLVYNTNTDGVPPNDVSPGYYYWEDGEWIRFDISSSNITPKEKFKPMDNNVTLDTAYEYVDLIEFDFKPNYNTSLISFNVAGSGHTQSVNAIILRVIITNASGTVLASFNIAPHMEDKADSATAIGWAASVANYPLEIPGFLYNMTQGQTYTYKLQAAIGTLYGPLEATIHPLTHPYHIGSLYVRDIDNNN